MRTILICLLVLFTGTGHAQSAKTGTLTIGDILPDVSIAHTVNSQINPAKLSDYKARIKILDFWATWCSPCYAAIPKIDTLQRQFKKSIKFIGVTREDIGLIVPFMDKLKTNRGFTPESITNDEALHSLLMPKTVPHYVWLDSSNKIIAITKNEGLTVINMKYALRGEYQKIKNDTVKLYDAAYDKKVLLNNSLVRMEKGDTLFYYDDSLHTSILTKYKVGLQSLSHYDNHHFIFSNLPLLSLLTYAFGERYPDAPSRVEIRIKDSSKAALFDKLQHPSDKNDFRYHYCYEIIQKDTVQEDPRSAKQLQFAMTELNDYFSAIGYQGKIEYANSKILALVVTDSSKLHFSGPAERPAMNKTMQSLQLNHKTLQELAYHLRSYYWQLTTLPPLYDETHVEQPVTIRIEAANMTSFEEVLKELRKNGLDIIEKSKYYNKIVIYDK